MKAIRRPMFWFGVATWVLSAVFAGLLIQLGAQIMSDVPKASKHISIEEFVDVAAREKIQTKIDDSRQVLRTRKQSLEDAQFELKSISLDYRNQRSSFEDWLKTRFVTESTDQNDAVIERAKNLEQLKNSERAAREKVDQIETQISSTQDELKELNEKLATVRADAKEPYMAALEFGVLKVFLLRLALTLPLVLVSGWLILRKRKSKYWPIYRGFILFSLFAFFVELVPYLPSYGGYVQYLVGIVLALVVARFLVKGMERYLQSKQDEQSKSEAEKRSQMEYETAVKKVNDGVCPSCDRTFSSKVSTAENGAADQKQDFCVHCGFSLFKKCENCGVRENSFYRYCGACGIQNESQKQIMVS